MVLGAHFCHWHWLQSNFVSVGVVVHDAEKGSVNDNDLYRADKKEEIETIYGS